jgi:hypothetical protein
VQDKIVKKGTLLNFYLEMWLVSSHICSVNPLIHKRQQILQQMEQIQRMEHGSLQAEKRPSVRHPDQGRGPYYKHQVWENGQNLTRRTAADKADALAQAIEGRKQFERLAEAFIDATVVLTRAKTSPDAKKNATSSRRPSKAKPPATSSTS